MLRIRVAAQVVSFINLLSDVGKFNLYVSRIHGSPVW